MSLEHKSLETGMSYYILSSFARRTPPLPSEPPKPSLPTTISYHPFNPWLHPYTITNLVPLTQQLALCLTLTKHQLALIAPLLLLIPLFNASHCPLPPQVMLEATGTSSLYRSQSMVMMKMAKLSSTTSMIKLNVGRPTGDLNLNLQVWRKLDPWLGYVWVNLKCDLNL